MSNMVKVEQSIYALEDEFNSLNNYKLSFKKESTLALQLLNANDFLLKTAINNPDSLKNAITNVAAIGISLNPATKEAYLVPRMGSVCLDISAIGLIKLATDSGSLEWVQAEIVKKADKFIFKGLGVMPVHEVDYFSDRGETVGVYTIAKTTKGDFLVTVMSTQECFAIRDRSEAWKAHKAGKVKSCPWATDEGEMLKKTVLKRASKLWPKSERVDLAVSAINEHEGIDFKKEQAPFVEMIEHKEVTQDDLKNIQELLVKNNRSADQMLKYLSTQFKTEIKSLEELTATHIDYVKRLLK